MSEIIFQKIKEAREIELPYDISKKVMRRIMLYRLNLPLILVGLFSVNFVYLCARIYAFLSNTGAFSIIKVMLNDFEMSWDYISESLDGLVETMPMTEVRLLIINVGLILILGWYSYHVYKANKKISAVGGHN